MSAVSVVSVVLVESAVLTVLVVSAMLVVLPNTLSNVLTGICIPRLDADLLKPKETFLLHGSSSPLHFSKNSQNILFVLRSKESRRSTLIVIQGNAACLRRLIH
ncbi:hypothetical protein BX661DRAFT_29821 [Kickxella alabastrina]|uniref:uncharacterized protein n=1 Tax=Kickxella alabastrina TaxID=61397 RepID=UPI00221F680A|nr:uncharacterized protein BX661DRAFT_29821 [Kickxella alabastrina]KAI7826725.1 hypothetical protein BX661DRAFT_29821 [Kickxella alabastrina]